MKAGNRERFIALWKRIGAKGDPSPLADFFFKAYSEPHRHYHNLRHISECLNELDSAAELASSAEAVELALWFHDVVYDTNAHDNEEQSALLARRWLADAGVENALIEKTCNLVLATKDHNVTLDRDAALVVDVDLSILGQPERRFLEYEQQIRAEYAWVEARLFARKRAEILEEFLSRPRIYSTGPFYDRYEKRARFNLQTSIAALRAQS
jgi:predicted metal-dependent HD superfamily phosphohydrolase